MKKDKIEITNRPTAFMTMDDPHHKPYDFVEVSEWTNGEGWDISISNDQIFSIHDTEFRAIKKLIKKLDKLKDK